jgi:hypothetical protein
VGEVVGYASMRNEGSKLASKRRRHELKQPKTLNQAGLNNSVYCV